MFEDENDVIKQISEKYKIKKGVFITLHRYDTKELRGCIGFPYPVLKLGKAVVEAAKAAAFSDPRFPPISKKELNNITIELSVLTEPREIKKSVKGEIVDDIRVGKDGLIVKLGPFSGLLLPQVAEEQKWNALELIENTCLKAGLQKDAWKKSKCKTYKFQAQIFYETYPGGKIVEKKNY